MRKMQAKVSIVVSMGRNDAQGYANLGMISLNDISRLWNMGSPGIWYLALGLLGLGNIGQEYKSLMEVRVRLCALDCLAFT